MRFEYAFQPSFYGTVSISSNLKTKIINAAATDGLANLVFDHRWAIEGSDRQELATALAELHNDCEINVLSVASPEALAHFTGPRFFNGQNIFLEIIPQLEANLDEMVSAVTALVEAGGSDLASNMPNGSFREWCVQDQTRSEEVISRALAGDETIRPFLLFALQAVGDLERIIACFNHEDVAIKMSAVSATSRLGTLDEPKRVSIYTAFDSLLDANSDGDLIANILGALLAVASDGKDVDTPKVQALVRRCLANPSDGVSHITACGLMQKQIPVGSPILDEVLERLLDIDPEKMGSIRQLDSGLYRLLEGEGAKAAIDFAGRLVGKTNGKISLKQLNSFTHRLIESDHEHFGYAVASWLIHGDIALGISLANAVGMREHPVTAPIDHFGLSEVQKLRLCRRTIGFFLLEPVLAASVLVSIARTAEMETQTEISRLLYNPILVNFSGKVRDYLRTIKPSDLAHAVVSQALEQLDALIKGFKEVGTINEINPSTNERFVASMHEFDEQQEVRRNAAKESIFADLIPHSVVLYGNKSISFIEGSDGERKRFETNLHSHEFSFELPRLGMFDPVTLEFLRRRFITVQVIE